MSKKSSSILLFTYDSHMDPATMAKVDEQCELMGIARAEGQRIAFTANGSTNVKPCDGETVWGTLWVVPATAMVVLDAWARANELQRGVLFIICPAGPRVPATTYFDAAAPEGNPRADEVQSLVLAARQAKLDARYVASLEAFQKDSR